MEKPERQNNSLNKKDFQNLLVLLNNSQIPGNAIEEILQLKRKIQTNINEL